VCVCVWHKYLVTKNKTNFSCEIEEEKTQKKLQNYKETDSIVSQKKDTEKLALKLIVLLDLLGSNC